MPMLSEQEIEAYLGEPHVAQLVTVRPDGRPHMAPVWFMAEGRRALVMASAITVKVRNIRRNPSVALSIATDQRPYKYVALEGEAQITGDGLARVVERMCVRYDGPARGRIHAEELLSQGQRVLVDIRVKRVISWKDD